MIVNMKDEASLDDLAKMFSADIEESNIDLERLIKKHVLTEQAIQMYKDIMMAKEIVEMDQVVSIKILKDKLAGGELTLPECQTLMRFIKEHYDQLTGESARIYVFRAMGVPFIMGAKSEKDVVLSDEYKIITMISLYEEASTIKFELM